MSTAKFGCLLLCLVVAKAGFGEPEKPYWQQNVHYKMDLTLLPIEHAVVGDEAITYTNNSPDSLTTWYLHLYPNAFRNNASTRAQEARRFFQKLVPHADDGGYIRIESFRLAQPGLENTETTVVNAYEINDTVLKVQLPRPLPPGATLTVELSFYLKVRKHKGRAGYRGFQYDFAQWYPKVAVYDENGWHPEPFHALGEFYGEFGTFDVTISTPAEYILGATGELVDGDPGWDLVKVDTTLSETDWQTRLTEIKDLVRQQGSSGQMRSATFHAENVHDFSWVASPDFLHESGDWQGTPIHVLYRSRAKAQWSKRVLRRAARALDWLSEKFGRYPYPQLTITHGLLGGGMEYPMLVMNSSESESLILHEVGHIYFYGILGNNEWQEAWLDEGFTTFQTRWYMESRYGKWGFNRKAKFQHGTWLQRHRPKKTSRESSLDGLLRYMDSGFNEPLARGASDYKDGLSYYQNVYTKGAFFYDMLKYVVGDSAFSKICREYFERWKFKHVNEQRFRAVCEDVTGQDLDWFFKQWLHETPKVDYALGNINKRKTEDGWATDVEVLKLESGTMPVEVRVTTESGETQTQRWPGELPHGKLSFVTLTKPTQVSLDPQDIVLDSRPENNGPLRTEFCFEYPGMSYSPRKAYLLTWRPSMWYNEVDKLRLGGRLRGRRGVARNAELGMWFGTSSKELDFRARYSNPVTALGQRTRGALLAQKMEGRIELDAHLAFVNSASLTAAPQHRFWVGANYTKLQADGGKYTRREYDQKADTTIQSWQAGEVYKTWFRYNVNPRGVNWFSNIVLGLDVVQEDWGSDFNFTSLFSEVRFWLPNASNGLFLRFYAQKISDSGSAPIQELVFLDGANPRDRFKRFYLRSHGGVPEEFHLHMPGGGNLRGYYNQPISGDQLLALNLEARRKFRWPFLRQPLRKYIGRLSAVAFFDLAGMEFLDSRKDVFADAGFGLRFASLLPDEWYTVFTGGRNLLLRLDFPIWVSKPLPGENHFRFRWVLGFEQAF